MTTYLILVSLLFGNASSREYVDSDVVFDQSYADEEFCTLTLTNNDTVVLDNVTLVNGLLGYRVEFYRYYFFTQWTKINQTSVLIGTTLGYNPFLNTVTFNAGQLQFTFDVCED